MQHTAGGYLYQRLRITAVRVAAQQARSTLASGPKPVSRPDAQQLRSSGRPDREKAGQMRGSGEQRRKITHTECFG